MRSMRWRRRSRAAWTSWQRQSSGCRRRYPRRAEAVWVRQLVRRSRWEVHSESGRRQMPAVLTHKTIMLLARERLADIRNVLTRKTAAAGANVNGLQDQMPVLATKAVDLEK